MFDHHDPHGLPTTCEMAERRLVAARIMVDAQGLQIDTLVRGLREARREARELRAERDRLLMKVEPDRIIAPMRLDELEQLGNGVLP